MNDPATLVRVQPTRETLRHWADHLLPDLDVWFWDDGKPGIDLTACLVMPRADYLQHPTFRDIRYVNAYLHWQMPAEVTHMIVSGPAWIMGVAASDRQRVLEKQVDLRRGLVYPRTHFDTLPESLQAHAVNDHVVLCHAAWEQVPDPIRRQVLLREQQSWDDAECFELPDDVPDHVRTVANTFGMHEGTNCLATTAYCVTGEMWMRDLWMHQPAFRDLIDRHGYRPMPGVVPNAGDVVTFEADGDIVHAAYCVEPDRFLNKNGQSRFNPTRVVDWAMLDADWTDTICVIYRR